LAATVPAVVLIVIAAVTTPPAGLTDAGAKAQVDSAGSPEQTNVTSAVNPPAGVTATVYVASSPADTVTIAGVPETVKVPGVAAATVSE
jgi:hypothetical protein